MHLYTTRYENFVDVKSTTYPLFTRILVLAKPYRIPKIQEQVNRGYKGLLIHTAYTPIHTGKQGLKMAARGLKRQF